LSEGVMAVNELQLTTGDWRLAALNKYASSTGDQPLAHLSAVVSHQSPVVSHFFIDKGGPATGGGP
jgi:hypothetical protein